MSPVFKILTSIILTTAPSPPAPNSPIISLGSPSDAASGDGYKPFPPVPGVVSRNLSGNSGWFFADFSLAMSFQSRNHLKNHKRL